MADLTPTELLAATAADMRAVAGAAADGFLGQWASRPSRDTSLVLLDVVAGDEGFVVAEECTVPQGTHIAAWDPEMARAVAAWLDAKATKYGAYPPEEQARMVATGTGTLAPMLAACRAWWASRGIEPTGTAT